MCKHTGQLTVANQASLKIKHFHATCTNEQQTTWYYWQNIHSSRVNPSTNLVPRASHFPPSLLVSEIPEWSRKIKPCDADLPQMDNPRGSRRTFIRPRWRIYTTTVHDTGHRLSAEELGTWLPCLKITKAVTLKIRPTWNILANHCRDRSDITRRIMFDVFFTLSESKKLGSFLWFYWFNGWKSSYLSSDLTFLNLTPLFESIAEETSVTN